METKNLAMSKIKIENFGPIKEGIQKNGDWIDIKKVTVFIGNQGSGKSSVAKLISTLTWIEKALVRGDFQEKELTIYNRFKKHCAYQNIGNYFKDDTFIEYQGKAYSITYKDGNTFVKKNSENGYAFPKIMYVPAERNFVSSVDKPASLKKLPNTLYTFLDEFEDAKQDLKGNLDLPIGNARFEYSKQNKISYIVGDDFKIRLSESSSGFQSFVPLFLVTRHLADSINKEHDASIKQISIEEEKRIRKEIESILSNPNLTEDIKNTALEVLSSRFKYACFINIVEEPEQNLYPSSQRGTLNSLVKFANMDEGNKLIMTTHSPYIINYLTLAVKAYKVSVKLEPSNNKVELRTQLNELVPLTSTINPDDLVIYELDDKGNIKMLDNYKGIPSDENELNEKLVEANDLFVNLISLEKSI